MSRKAAYGVLVTVLSWSIASAVILPFGCPTQASVNSNVLSTYLTGTWYEYSRYTGFGKAYQCPSEAYKPAATAGLYDVTRTWISGSGDATTVKGQMKQAVPGGPEAVLSLLFSEAAYEGQQNAITKANYHILAYEVSNYAVVWDCISFFFFHIQTLRILTRVRVPADEVVAAAYKQANDRGIKTNFLRKNQQTNC
ncbi:apolipoprotein D [Hyalella azteca]|uniref:Apolipoprotein D n=1 Tax=Hyalella azteca TaxID=294128 RepID=A0A8B7P8J2_HYAAZ|nr:apolipoprotein D [Hyalella azteca]XP_047736172.1 apolipoprotein D [Hyalella azteca]